MKIKNKTLLIWLASLGIFIFMHNFSLAADYYAPSVGLPGASTDIRGILANILAWLLSIVGMVAIIAFVVSGLQYFMAAGNEKMMETAKTNLVWSTVGIIVAISGFIIVRAIDTALNAGGVF